MLKSELAILGNHAITMSAYGTTLQGMTQSSRQYLPRNTENST